MKLHSDKMCYNTRKLIDAAEPFLSRMVVDPTRNQQGNIIVIALMVLVIMTVIGTMSSRTVVTENFIIRNQGIYKQNVNMVESALMEGMQRFMQIEANDADLADVNTAARPWINNMNDPWAAQDWYTPDSSDRILDAGNSLAIATPRPLADRNEAAAGNLRMAFVGWASEEGESLGVGAGKVVIRRGRLMAEYASRTAGGADGGFGMLRMEIGVRREIILN